MGSGTRRLARLRRVELSKETRLALVEPFGMKGLLEPELLVVEMVTELVKKRAKKRLELHDLDTLCGSHPYRDSADAVFCRLVETM